jgi:hypothetical protein
MARGGKKGGGGGRGNRRDRVPIKLGDRDLYTREEAAGVLRMGLSTLALEISDKYGPPELDSVKVGRKRLITDRQLRDYMRRKGLLEDDE